MARFQVFRGEHGTYKWRLVEANGEVVQVRPGKVTATGFSGAKKRSVEKALDAALARMAAEGVKQAGA